MASGKVLILPCSGIGKVNGLISRESTYLALEGLGPDQAGTLCLALLVTREEDALAAIQSHSCITVDGCAKLCALKNLEMAGGKSAKSIVVLDALKEYRGLQPGGPTALTDDGWTIARAIATDIVEDVQRGLGRQEG